MNWCFYTTGICQGQNTFVTVMQASFPAVFILFCMFINLKDVDAGQYHNMKLNYVVYIDKESTSAGLYGGILPVVDTCTIPYVDVLYMNVNVD